MSARIPVQQLGRSAFAAARSRSTYWIGSTRAFSSSIVRSSEEKDASAAKSKSTTDPDLSNAAMEEYLARNQPGDKPPRPNPRTGGLSKNSIFDRRLEVPGYDPGMTGAEIKALKRTNAERAKEEKARREKELHSVTLDPVPLARRKFERQMVIRGLEKRRVGKAVRIKRTERESTFKSQDFPTSVKKMMRLMHQIAGKTVEEALIQMRFSKKRVARDIVKGLQIARDEAIAARGMGLGAGISAEQVAKEDELIRKGKMKEHERSSIYLADGTRRREAKSLKETIIELKDGSKKTVTDPTEMYIDQAWATKGPEMQSPEFRARGRVNMLTHRTAKFNVLLKEEKTRMRISDEIKKKRANKPLWQPLPDRPVTTQRQYNLW